MTQQDKANMTGRPQISEAEYWQQRAETAEKALAEARKDSERLDWLEKESLNRDEVGNGLAISPVTKLDGSRLYCIDELGDEDGSDLGCEIAQASTLRAAIDAAKEGK